MPQVKVGTSNMSVLQKIAFAKQVVLDMTGNAYFTTPAPTLASVTTATTALETGYNAAKAAYDLAKSKMTAVDPLEEALDLLLVKLGNYVFNTSGGDASQIDSSGFSTRDVPSGPIGPLGAPQALVVLASQSAGVVNLSWRKLRGASGYIIQRAVDAPSLEWTYSVTSTKTKFTMDGLTSGTKYWFRVAGTGAASQGDFTEPMAKFAP